MTFERILKETKSVALMFNFFLALLWFGWLTNKRVKPNSYETAKKILFIKMCVIQMKNIANHDRSIAWISYYVWLIIKRLKIISGIWFKIGVFIWPTNRHNRDEQSENISFKMRSNAVISKSFEKECQNIQGTHLIMMFTMEKKWRKETNAFFKFWWTYLLIDW